MVIGTGELLLMRMSGNVNGLELIGWPLMLVTIIVGVGSVGTLGAYGAERTTNPPLTLLTPPRLLDSKRVYPKPPFVSLWLQPQPFPPLWLTVPVPWIVLAISLTEPPAPADRKST